MRLVISLPGKARDRKRLRMDKLEARLFQLFPLPNDQHWPNLHGSESMETILAVIRETNHNLSESASQVEYLLRASTS